jgi:hypothetical protein
MNAPSAAKRERFTHRQSILLNHLMRDGAELEWSPHGERTLESLLRRRMIRRVKLPARISGRRRYVLTRHGRAVISTFDTPATSALLACPFCGGMPSVQPWHGGPITKRMVECDGDDCPAHPCVTGDTLGDAVTRWNTRQ